MKNLNLIHIIVALLISNLLTAQEQLRVEYELIIPKENFTDMDLPAHVEIKIPKQMFELVLSKEESIWKSIELINNEQNEKGSIVATISFAPSGVYYKNLKEKNRIDQQEGYNKQYLIIDSLEKFEWKISRENKEILGIKTLKATYKDEESQTEYTAWYAPKLNFTNGPAESWGLPGIILEFTSKSTFDNNAFSQTYIATKIDVIEPTQNIKKPTKGIKISQEEFNKTMTENYNKMKEMQGQGVDKD